MSRINLTETPKTLDELIPQYAEDKQVLDNYKKICDASNSNIKLLMSEQSLDKYEVDGWRATKSVSSRDTVNTDKLLELLSNINDLPAGIIKTMEYVDMDALEKAVYNNKVSKEVLLAMDSCIESKEVVSLRISKIKTKKENDNV